MNIEAFLFTLPYMAKGMLGIFTVTAILILGIVILNKCTSRPDKKESAEVNVNSSDNQ